MLSILSLYSCWINFKRFLEQLTWLRNIFKTRKIIYVSMYASHHLETALQKITNYRNELTEDKQEAIAVAERFLMS